MAINRKRSNRAYGLDNALQDLAPQPISAQRAPGTNDFALPGTVWLDQSGANDAYVLLKVAANSATWLPIGSGSGTFDNLTVTGILTVDGSIAASTTGTIALISDAASATAVSIDASDATGGVAIIGNTGGVSVTGVLGPVVIESSEDDSEAVYIHADGGTSETIYIHAEQGTAANAIAIESEAGGITLDGAAVGNITMVPGTNSAAGVALTLSSRIGVATFTGQTTASGAQETFTITNTLVTAASALQVTVTNVGTNDARMTLEQVKPAAGSFEVMTQNNGAAALNGDVIISWILLG